VKLKNYIFGLAALCAIAFVPATPAHAQSNSPQDSALLDALVKKGVLSDQEAEDISSQEQKAYASTGASKIQMPSSIKSITFYGDLRLRYEMRDGTTGSGYTGSGGALATHGDTQTLNRFRYRLRIGLKGDLYDNFFYGIRASSNPYYDRSGNVNFGASDGGGEFGKARNILALDQVYLGFKPTSDITLVGGMQPQPFYTTSMVWSDDINPTGASEKWDHTFDNGLETFVTLGQYVYAAANGNGISNPVGAPDASTTFMYAEQVGFKYNIDKDTFFKGAASFYTYSGSYNTTTTTVAGLYSASPSVLSAPNQSPSFFNGPFVGAASAGAVPGSANVSGINDLAVLEVPLEFDFKIGPGVHQTTSGDPKDMKNMTETTTGWSLPVRLFSDFAYNVEAAARAGQARGAIQNINGTASLGNASVTGAGTVAGNQSIVASPSYQGVLHSGTNLLDQVAYQVGAEVGSLKKKGDWDGKLFWQSTGYYAVDPNLIDADTFNAATNMQGVVASIAHNWTDGLSSTLRYAYAMPVNGLLATPNVNQDLTLGNIRSYNLFQADLMWKF
jgi:hypothetical protein